MKISNLLLYKKFVTYNKLVKKRGASYEEFYERV